jgi:integrase
MTDLTFMSGVGVYIKMFIQQKQSSGYPYHSSSRILCHFDTMIAKKFPDACTITKDICQEWLHLHPNEHPNGLLRRVTPVRQLSKYMSGIGIQTYLLPGHIPNKQIKYEAHIYTEKELKAFFHSIDTCPKSPFSPTRCYVIPVIFRLLYCCGMRSSEARLLLVEDVDLCNGRVIIRESKGWRARIIYMSKDLLDICREYHALIDRMIPGHKVFFPNKEGNTFSKSAIDTWFHEFWDHLPEAVAITGNHARVHDLRHSYAVDRLNGWVMENENISALLPYLSEYMGHSNYADTDYYLSLVESFYPEMEMRLSEINDDILPEVHYEKK